MDLSQPHRHLTPEKAVEFPNLRQEDYRITSEEDGYYNCAAWAIGDGVKDFRVDPTDSMAYWPSNLPKDTRSETFIRFYSDFHGFEKCTSGAAESGFVKIAIYSDENGVFTHVARQLNSGKWTSKLGDWEDVEHANVECLYSKNYGKSEVFMRKKVT